ncbi:T9SS C-terminal target domain-containing protein, partial [Bacteroidetes/Chlorobi group bacterium ChocPot_Mid]
TKPGEYWVKGKANNGCERITEKIFFNEFDYPPAPVIEQNGNLLSANAGETEVSGYKWYLNDTLIQGATQKDYLISVDGLYKVEITDKNGCKSISDEFNAVVNVDENQIYNNIRIYPNPTENEFNILIRNEDCNEAVITVSNILGNEIAKMNANLSNITDNVLKINLSDKPSGIYFIELKICNERFYSKINKSR